MGPPRFRQATSSQTRDMVRVKHRPQKLDLLDCGFTIYIRLVTLQHNLSLRLCQNQHICMQLDHVRRKPIQLSDSDINYLTKFVELLKVSWIMKMAKGYNSYTWAISTLLRLFLMEQKNQSLTFSDHNKHLYYNQPQNIATADFSIFCRTLLVHLSATLNFSC